MAVYAILRVFLVVFLHFLLVSNTECIIRRSKNGCAICGKKSQLIDFQNLYTYVDELRSCFDVNPEATRSNDICEGCRRAVQVHRVTGKTFFHVSIEFINYLCSIVLEELFCSSIKNKLLNITIFYGTFPL